MQTTKTYQPKAKEVTREWKLFDADGEVLGRLATQISIFLMGKHKPKYSNHLDMGDFVVVINAKKIMLTGNKMKDKVYRKHSGYPGGFKEVSITKMMEEQPERVIEIAVSGMLPSNRLKSPRMKRLRVFKGKDHPYAKRIKKES